MVNVPPPVNRLKRAALDLLFPRWCLGCGREGGYVCRSCRETLPAIAAPVCTTCGRPLADGHPCPDCAGRQLRIDGIRAPFLFDGLVRNIIHEFKYRNLRAVGPDLAGLLNEYLDRNPLPGDVLVPVPLHPRRLRERGYNQSRRLADRLGKLRKLPVVADSLTRPRYTPPLARSPDIESRRTAVAGAFAVKDGQLKGKMVILIDDVSTSGATLDAAAGALKEAGAAAVRGLVFALEL